jgi:cyclohexyl-isocyanide hydratase
MNPNEITRRTAGRQIKQVLAGGLAAQLVASAQTTRIVADDMTPPPGYTMGDMGGLKHFMPPQPERIAMLVYPGITALDLIGPQQAFGYTMGTKVSLVWKTTDPIVTDTASKSRLISRSMTRVRSI